MGLCPQRVTVKLLPPTPNPEWILGLHLEKYCRTGFLGGTVLVRMRGPLYSKIQYEFSSYALQTLGRPYETIFDQL